jgi:hypothetical protein
MDKSVSCRKKRARIHGRTQRFKKFAFLLLFGTVLVSLTAATANGAGSTSLAANATQAQPLVGQTTHPIQYWIGCGPSVVDDGSSLTYFQQHGFTAVVLVVPDSKTYQTELNTIKSLGMTPIIDVEMPIWAGGQLSGTPITSFGSYFQSLENAGWHYVASEGGRTGDLAYMKNYFQGYVNFNCDQCGLWGNVYKDPFTVANSWESYYTSEWPYIQSGSTQAAALGIQNGLLAGVWANVNGDNQILANSLSGSAPSYKSMLDWSYANGIGFTSFQVWCGDNQGLSQYKACGFESVVANLQQSYPATNLAGGWGWSSIGGQLASGTGPAVCAQDANSLDVFIQGTDHALWHKHFQSGSGWSAWESLGGIITSSPAATSSTSGVIDVYVRGSDGALWSRQLSGGVWGSWSENNGQLLAGTGPAAYNWGTTRTGVFVTGTDHALWHMWNDSAGQSSWENLGGILTSSPAATSRSSGTIDVFVRGSDGNIWQKSYATSTAGGWGAWSTIGGKTASGTGPAADAQNANSLDVFVQGSDQALWHTSSQGSVWSAWGPLGGVLTSSPAATAPGNGMIYVFVRSAGGVLWERT